MSIVVMGSTTWEDPDMPRPLPKRTNVLVTTRKDDYPGAHYVYERQLNYNVKNSKYES